MVERRSRVLTVAAIAIGAALMAGVALAGGPGVDPSIGAGDDFYGYANNGWLNAARIPEGASSVDSSAMLRVLNAGRTRALVDDAVQASSRGQPVAPDVRKIADYYTARLDGGAIEGRGLAPISHDLAAIAAIDDRHALAAYLGRTLRLDDGSNQQTDSLWGIWVHQGFHDPYRNAAHVVQGGLGLSDPADYLDAAPEHAAHRMLYQAHVAALLKMAGFDRPEARAARVADLETAIARTHASRADTDDVFKTDNDWQRDDFVTRAPGVDWATYFAAAGIGPATPFVVWQPQSVIGGAKLVADQPLDAWKDYLALRLIAHYAAVLPRAVGDEGRAFEARLAGAPAPAAPELAPLALAATQDVFGDAIGRRYVARYFPPRAKASVTAMVGNIRTAWRTHLTGLRWMSPATRQKALAKLAAMRVGLGYPERWTDYAPLAVARGDAFGNFQRAEAFAYRRAVAKLGRPVDPGEWPAGLYPQTVGAILDISPNSIEFAAGLFQPPYFDPDGDAAANYGSAGAGLAHEIGHGFDELGNLYDAQGRLGLWWTAEDGARYHAAAAPLIAQLDSCGHGKQILSESALDLAGLIVAHDAYRLSLHGRPDWVRNGLTGDQRFFLAFAQRWRKLQTDAAARRQIASDTHAPPPCRGNLVRNVAAWTRAFGVKPGDRLYVKPEDGVSVW